MWDEYAIVDDNKFDRLICSRIIRRLDESCPIVEFQSGKEVFDYVASSAFSARHLLIFLDINMPEMTGYEFLDKLIRHDVDGSIMKRVRVVVITSSTRSEDRDQAARYESVVDFVQKPLIIDEIAPILRADH